MSHAGESSLRPRTLSEKLALRPKMTQSGTYLAVISTLPMAFAMLRLTDVSIIMWVTNDFGGGDFPKKRFLMDYLLWKEEKPALGIAMFVLNLAMTLTKLDVIRGLLQRLQKIYRRQKRFHTRHFLDLVDCAAVLGIYLARIELKLASAVTIQECDKLDGMRWNARAIHQTERCEKEAFNLRRLYVSMMALNIVMLACPIIRHFQWERHVKQKAANSA